MQKGATEAQDEWVDLHENQLAPGQRAPSKKFFRRQKKKMATYGTVENRVCSLNFVLQFVLILSFLRNFAHKSNMHMAYPFHEHLKYDS